MQKFVSSRNKSEYVSAPEAIVRGLAGDGGLYTPLDLTAHIDPGQFKGCSYRDIATKIISSVFEDFKEEEIRNCVEGAYDSKFDDPSIAPLRKCSEGYICELWHGPTSAFKDLALTLLPRLLTLSYEKLGESKTVAILTATSGDTGKAALSGFADVPNTDITVFYPLEGVSKIQQLQMQTSRGSNVEVVAVKGNFDDCQRMVKEAGSDPLVLGNCRGVTISSANSINIGRLIPQIVYYYSSYASLLSHGIIQNGDYVNFSVPTGNFGDILAGYMAKMLGLPIRKLICASNSNNVLTDFINTGCYDIRRPFHTTISPSMDILISSNLERLLFMLSGDDRLVASLMKELKENGFYQINEALKDRIQAEFKAYWASEDECRSEISRMWKEEDIIIDPHTSVAVTAAAKYRTETGDKTPCIILSTASPFKFSKDVLSCIEGELPEDEMLCMEKLSQITGNPIPKGLAELSELPVRFTRSISKEDGIAFIAAKMSELSKGNNK